MRKLLAQVAILFEEDINKARDEINNIEAHDLWIAASALAHNCSLITRNVREFERVPGLDVVVW